MKPISVRMTGSSENVDNDVIHFDRITNGTITLEHQFRYFMFKKADPFIAIILDKDMMIHSQLIEMFIEKFGLKGELTVSQFNGQTIINIY